MNDYKIHEIAEFLIKNNESRLGLMLGEAGVILSLFYYNKIYNKREINTHLDIRVENLLEQIQNAEINSSISNGITGVGWVLSHLSNQNFINISQEEALSELDVFLDNYIDSASSYDYLHGYLGIGMYFIERRKSDSVKKVVEKLLSEIQYTNQGSYWVDSLGLKNRVYINLGLAHGLSGIVSFLSKAAMSFESINDNNVRSVITSTVDFILSQRHKSSYYHSMYPGTIRKNQSTSLKNSRLAWCYGDLSVAIALKNASQALSGGKNYLPEMKQIVNNSIKRKGFEKTAVKDFAFCHGTSGVAHLYKKIGIFFKR